ncbi:CarD family transcriptional regulator [Corynebacterium sp. NML98-0116]|uniref:CarD family transcriptional regulator n=1 Tax=Corynebacterium pseudogenitalium TaxID=38303 RepID=A0ABD4TV46_9CORY|nr:MULTISPECIES: CarD family transcriptional regulator [Corynebacterium]AOX05050.1 CarD family transcriptional regulator [Corynebacterium sp. NML98-0116]MCQ4608685.1 CarD family transcriptional regulator [Corynebacterium pseudogenitalium]MCQ4610224.1 CarD family transcriptional regulator [Corynebacterium sp. CCUG 61414]MCQ4612352.1 CarD family transcriptional regulator [Corynebacterium sp. CCUG 51687]MCQ4614646.1 CarD family transcriptional regulator [Corynebacterium pseudogenitalium]
MEFKVGEVVVYPHHGAARIADIEQREIGGETLDFLVLQILQSDLEVRVPVKNTELVGVRDVVGKEGLEKVFSVLRETDVEEAGNWSRRYKANQERLASGDINKVAEVVRDLWRRDQGKGLSAGEKRMLGKARQILVGELALAEPVDEKKVEELEEGVRKIIEEQVKAGISFAPDVVVEDEDDIDLDDLSFDDDEDDEK